MQQSNKYEYRCAKLKVVLGSSRRATSLRFRVFCRCSSAFCRLRALQKDATSDSAGSLPCVICRGIVLNPHEEEPLPPRNEVTKFIIFALEKQIFQQSDWVLVVVVVRSSPYSLSIHRTRPTCFHQSQSCAGGCRCSPVVLNTGGPKCRCFACSPASIFPLRILPHVCKSVPGSSTSRFRQLHRLHFPKLPDCIPQLPFRRPMPPKLLKINSEPHAFHLGISRTSQVQ